MVWRRRGRCVDGAVRGGERGRAGGLGEGGLLPFCSLYFVVSSDIFFLTVKCIVVEERFGMFDLVSLKDPKLIEERFKVAD